MRITGLGHAGIKVEAQGSTVLCDPWFSLEGAFQASWFPFPDNHGLLSADIFLPDAIIISHEHMDHVDPWFLERVPSDVPVFIPSYPSDVLRRKILSAGGRNVHEVDSAKTVEVAEGIRVYFVPEESPMNHDSAMVIQGEGRVFLNLNDARLSGPQLRGVRAAVGGHVDVLALQAAGASWYPVCYRMPPDRLIALCRRKRLAKFSYVARAVQIVGPSVALPFAGPPCFLDSELIRHNDQIGENGIFPDQQQALDWLRAHGVANTALLLPGDVWDAEHHQVERSDRWADFSFADRDAYIAAYAQRRASAVQAVRRRHPTPSACLWDAFEGYFDHVLDMSPYFNERIGMRVGFNILGPGGGSWAVDFRSGRKGVYDELGECQYVYEFESRWLPPILARRVPWEDFLLSLRFSAWRDPDRYNDHLLGLLKFAWPEALEAVEQYERSLDGVDSIVVRSEGRDYRVQRYCPHAGQDLLETGEVLPGGILRCLGHHYEYELRTGSCLNGTSKPLRTQPVGDAGTSP